MQGRSKGHVRLDASPKGVTPSYGGSHSQRRGHSSMPSLLALARVHVLVCCQRSSRLSHQSCCLLVAVAHGPEWKPCSRCWGGCYLWVQLAAAAAAIAAAAAHAAGEHNLDCHLAGDWAVTVWWRSCRAARGPDQRAPPARHVRCCCHSCRHHCQGHLTHSAAIVPGDAASVAAGPLAAAGPVLAAEPGHSSCAAPC